jgi:hypothetical protein
MSTDATNAPFNWREHLPVHPAADLFPPLSEPELQELAEDIRKNGLQHPIVIRRNPASDWRSPDNEKYQLLDGRNRLDALALLGWLGAKKDAYPFGPWPVGIHDRASATKMEKRKRSNDPREKWFDSVSHLPDNDAVYRYVIAANLHRRHLSAEDKRKVIAELLKRKPESSDRTIGQMVKADHKTVGAVRADLQSTGEISPVEKRVGADGKARKQPAKRDVTDELDEPDDPTSEASFHVIDRCLKKVQASVLEAIDSIPVEDEQTFSLLFDQLKGCVSLLQVEGRRHRAAKEAA